MTDYLIQGGTIIDGTGAPPVIGDLAIQNGRILFVGPKIPSSLLTKLDPDHKKIEVKGLVVSPGFIDINTAQANSVPVGTKRYYFSFECLKDRSIAFWVKG